MTDNVVFQSTTPATAPEGMTVATDNIDGKQFQRMKFTIGEDGTNDGDVSETNPMPVTSSSDNPVYITLSGGTVLDGTITKQFTQDNNSEQLLSGIFKELKKMNLHMAILTDTIINNSEVE